MIEAQATTREGRRPERTVYAITPAGVEEFEDWLAELLSTPVKEYLAFEAGLSLAAALPPDEVARLLDHRASELRIDIRAMEAMHDVARERNLPRAVPGRKPLSAGHAHGRARLRDQARARYPFGNTGRRAGLAPHARS